MPDSLSIMKNRNRFVVVILALKVFEKEKMSDIQKP
jgi:hypothetical protein